MQIRNKEQLDHESLQEFDSSVERMVHQAYPKASSEMRDDIIADTFINGIKDPAIKEAVLLSGKRNSKYILGYSLMVQGAKEVAKGRVSQDRQLTGLPILKHELESKWFP